LAAFGGGTGARITIDLSVFLMSPGTGERDAKACWTRWAADQLRTQPWSVGRLSRSIVQDELPAGTLKPLLSKYTLDGDERTALILYSGQPHKAVAVRRFVDFVVARHRQNSPQSDAIPLPFIGRGQHVFNNSELLWQSMCTRQRVDNCPGTSHRAVVRAFDTISAFRVTQVELCPVFSSFLPPVPSLGTVTSLS
jgi:hypothetical protein